MTTWVLVVRVVTLLLFDLLISNFIKTAILIRSGKAKLAIIKYKNKSWVFPFQSETSWWNTIHNTNKVKTSSLTISMIWSLINFGLLKITNTIKKTTWIIKNNGSLVFESRSLNMKRSTQTSSLLKKNSGVWSLCIFVVLSPENNAEHFCLSSWCNSFFSILGFEYFIQ